ncbi:uncharacterized protein LOC106942719, partial [Poecilia latipinna]|uniref:uncharacterized protein LOC106942719 n=1 Tax=Poecilia latipinna TaxID=48699 RepID=UPI00072E8B28
MAVLSESQYNELLGDLVAASQDAERADRAERTAVAPQLHYDLQGDRVATHAVTTRSNNRLSLTKARTLWSEQPNTSACVKPEQKTVRGIFDPESVINLIDSQEEEKEEEEKEEEEKGLLKDRAQEDRSGSTASQQGRTGTIAPARPRYPSPIFCITKEDLRAREDRSGSTASQQDRTNPGLQTAGSRGQSAAPAWDPLNAAWGPLYAPVPTQRRVPAPAAGNTTNEQKRQPVTRAARRAPRKKTGNSAPREKTVNPVQPPRRGGIKVQNKSFIVNELIS